MDNSNEPRTFSTVLLLYKIGSSQLIAIQFAVAQHVATAAHKEHWREIFWPANEPRGAGFEATKYDVASVSGILRKPAEIAVFAIAELIPGIYFVGGTRFILEVAAGVAFR